MKENRINPERCVAVMAFIFLCVALYASLNLPGPENSIVPSQKIVVAVHSVCVLIAFSLIFRHSLALEAGIMLCESILTTLTGHSQLGIFLFYGMFVLLFVKEKFKTRTKTKVSILFILHLASILCCYKQGYITVLLTLATSVFYNIFIYWIYDILKLKLACFLPAKISSNDSISEAVPGSELHLLDYNLTERQADLIIDNLHSNCSYKELSEKYFVSISTVKKEFSDVYKIFGVTKLEELHLLLLQYQVSK